MRIALLENEYWYGGYTSWGTQMPIGAHDEVSFVLRPNSTPNQAMPLLLSSRGRCLWLETTDMIEVADGVLVCTPDAVLETPGKTLQEAYLYAMKKYFPFTQTQPSPALFKNPIFNTWIELTFYQNQCDVMHYAENILKNGFAPGVLMIDDGWAESYGDWRPHSGKFPDAVHMFAQLHEMGFEVMLWVCPYVTPDTVAYRYARDAGYLIKNADGSIFFADWWNGHSAAVDLSNEAACSWLHEQFSELMALGVDGFKFDGGDSIYYAQNHSGNINVSPETMSQLWAKFGERYAYNEYRATWRAGGRPLFQRLCDKEHSWGLTGLAALVPDTLAQGITGHPFCCADMVGGGEYLNFQEKAQTLDGELFVRHAGVSCLMPSIQFSAAPWRILTSQENEQIHAQLALRMHYMTYIESLMQKCAHTGEPAVRYMEYVFPHENMETVKDQFMLGTDLLVAPMLEKGAHERIVHVPKGGWRYGESVLHSKGAVKMFSSPDGLPIVLERIST